MTCPRCINGLMVKESDKHGAYLSCLACGYVHEDVDLAYLMELDPLEVANEGTRRQRSRTPSHGKMRL